MTATQAPTPGPLPNMPAVDLTDDMLFTIETGETVTWGDLKRRFRLAPTALVEASGSVGLAASEIGAHITKRDFEYEAALADLTITPDASSLDEFGRSIFGALSDCPAMSIDKQADFVARALWPAVSALRPQPSGETREAVARLEAELAHPCRVGSKCSVDADDLRALLSARPLALRGQQGVPQKWVEVARYATERGLTVHESNMRMEEFRRVVTPAAVLSVSADEEIK